MASSSPKLLPTHVFARKVAAYRKALGAFDTDHRLQELTSQALADALEIGVAATRAKRRGTRRFSDLDKEKIILRYGTPGLCDQIRTYMAFRQDLAGLIRKLPIATTDLANLIGIPYHELIRRLNNPDRWQTDEVVQLGDAVAKLITRLSQFQADPYAVDSLTTPVQRKRQRSTPKQMD